MGKLTIDECYCLLKSAIYPKMPKLIQIKSIEWSRRILSFDLKVIKTERPHSDIYINMNSQKLTGTALKIGSYYDRVAAEELEKTIKYT